MPVKTLAALSLLLITGIVFFVGAPTQYVNNIAFQLKLPFIGNSF